MDQGRILFCDYDGEYEYADVLSRLGYAVDQIRPDGLRAVSVGEHSLYVFLFEAQDQGKQAMKIVEKLKSAQLHTPIFLLCRSTPWPEFLNHSESEKRANAYLTNPASEGYVLDKIDELIGLPPLQIRITDEETGEVDTELLRKMDIANRRIQELEAQIESQKGTADSLDKALEAQRNFYKPKLKALLEGQKIQMQTETEHLQVKLSEIEARLLEREARVKELEQSQRTQKEKMSAMVASHEKAQESLRNFYQLKIKKMSETSGS